MPAPKRPKYFQSQFLVVRDFQDEQAYHEEMLRRHNRLMHDWGVVRDGLRVTKDGGDYKIEVGSAIDSEGREIVLEKAGNLSAADLTAARAAQGSEPNISITIEFDEDKSDVPEDNYPPPGGKDNVTRMMQKPKIAFKKSPAGTDVILARVKANGDVDYSTRRLAGSFVRGSGSSDLCISTDGKVGIGTKSPNFPLQVGSTDDNGTWKLCVAGKGSTGNYRQWTLRTGDGDNAADIHKFRIRDEQGAADRLTIDQTGNVGVGTMNPEGQLQIGDGCNRTGIGPTPDTPNNPTLYNADYGTAYLGFNAVRTAQGWRRSSDGSNNGGSIIYNRIQGELCFVTLEKNDKEFLSDGEIKDRKRMIIDATGNVSIAKDLTVTGALNTSNGIQLNNKPLKFRAGDDNHGICYYGGGAQDAGEFAIDGPVLYGWSGGALGTSQGKKIALRWDSSGKVGIGATVPATKLHVVGSGYAFPATTGAQQSAGHVARLKDSSNLILDIGGNGGNGFWLQSTDLLNLATNYPLLLNPNGGNVGIGTTDPGTSKLKIADSATDFGHVRFASAGGGELEIVCWTGGWNINNKTGGKNLHLNRDANSGSDLLLGRYQNELIVKGNGNVGIGTTAPLGPLSIGNSAIDGSDGYIVIGKRAGGSTRHCRIGYDSAFRFIIGDYGNMNNAETWRAQFAIDWNAPANSLLIKDTGGGTVRMETIGPVMQRLDIIACGGRGDWGAQDHPIKNYFRDRLRGKPVGTYLRAIQDHPSWRGHYWQGWVDADGKVRVIHNYYNTTEIAN